MDLARTCTFWREQGRPKKHLVSETRKETVWKKPPLHKRKTSQWAGDSKAKKKKNSLVKRPGGTRGFFAKWNWWIIVEETKILWWNCQVEESLSSEGQWHRRVVKERKILLLSSSQGYIDREKFFGEAVKWKRVIIQTRVHHTKGLKKSLVVFWAKTRKNSSVKPSSGRERKILWLLFFCRPVSRCWKREADILKL